MTTTIVPELVTVAEAAAELRVSTRTIRRWVTMGDLPAVRLRSGGVRIYAADLSGLLRTRKEVSGHHGRADRPADLRGRP